MISFLTAFFTSFIITIFIIRTKKVHGVMSGDHDLDGPQKFHKTSVPRIGGLGITIGLFASIAFGYAKDPSKDQYLLLFLCALPAFGIGIAEDITKLISVRMRLLFTAIGATLAYVFVNVKISGLDIPGIDFLFTIPLVSIVFTIFAITGLANAYNIIDGFNGLSSTIGFITLIALAYIGIKFNDPFIYILSFTMAGAILGFLLLNYPRGLIFLGDGGAYLIGFWVASISVLLVARHNEISPWFALLISAYPIIETLFTIYRRKFHQGKSPGHPDGIHLHSLIFRRILNPSCIHSELEWFNANARTSPYLWIISSLAIIPGIFFYESTPTLIGFFILFIVFYLWIYKKIVAFKTPKFFYL